MLPTRVENILDKAHREGVVFSYQDRTQPIQEISVRNHTPIVVSVTYATKATQRQRRRVERELEAEGLRPTTRDYNRVVYRGSGSSPLYIPPKDPEPNHLYEF